MSDCQNRKAYFRAYSQSDKGKAVKKQYAQSEKGKRTQKQYNQSKKGKINHYKSNIRHYALHPERLKARQAVSVAVKSGKLPQPDSLQCYHCPEQAYQYHHWKGYSVEYLLDVIPVCQKCHQKNERRIA